MNHASYTTAGRGTKRRRRTIAGHEFAAHTGPSLRIIASAAGGINSVRFRAAG
jgi:hypothetical protein